MLAIPWFSRTSGVGISPSFKTQGRKQYSPSFKTQGRLQYAYLTELCFKHRPQLIIHKASNAREVCSMYTLAPLSTVEAFEKIPEHSSQCFLKEERDLMVHKSQCIRHDRSLVANLVKCTSDCTNCIEATTHYAHYEGKQEEPMTHNMVQTQKSGQKDHHHFHDNIGGLKEDPISTKVQYNN